MITECSLAIEVERFVNKSFGVFKISGSKQSVEVKQNLSLKDVNEMNKKGLK